MRYRIYSIDWSGSYAVVYRTQVGKRDFSKSNIKSKTYYRVTKSSQKRLRKLAQKYMGKHTRSHQGYCVGSNSISRKI